MSKKSYKYAVVGSSLSAILTFITLSRKGESCALFENTDELAKFNKKSDEFESLEFSNIYKLMDKKEEAEGLYEWVCNSLFSENCSLEDVESSPKTFNEGKMSDFVGFGDFKAKSLDELSHYNQLSFRRLNDNFIEKTEAALGEYSDHIFKGALVTGFNLGEENKKIESITINGNKEFAVEEIIFCSSPKSLLSLMPVQLNERLKQKISKAKFYSQLVLDLKFKNPIEKKPEHYFLYSRKEEFEPSMGYFENSTEGAASSQWTSLLPEESTEDFEYVGKSLRNIKKQVKRAFPKGFEEIAEEKVTLVPGSFGYLELSEADLKKIPENLLLSGPLTSPFSGVSADLDSAKKCLESL